VCPRADRRAHRCPPLAAISTIEERLKAGVYHSLEQFLADWKTLITNCKTYNDASSIYYQAAEGIQAALVRMLRHHISVIPG
jgi:hypothetical protein